MVVKEIDFSCNMAFNYFLQSPELLAIYLFPQRQCFSRVIMQIYVE